MREAMQAAIAAYLDASEITRAELEARCAKYKAVIDRAPHHESCGFWVGMFKKNCDCWKKSALTEGGEHEQRTDRAGGEHHSSR